MASKRERERRLARERYERRQVRRADKERVARRWTISVLAAVVVLAIAFGGYLLFRPGGGSAAAAKDTATPSASASSSASAPASSAAAAPVAEPAHHCTYSASGTAARKVSFPPATPDYTATYQARIDTNRGVIVIDLLNSKATCTVNSFISLAAQKYFNDTPCHRLTISPNAYFILQCGDPTGTGKGGPGYSFDDENLTGAAYPAGTLAMANGGANTNGSQFFMVYKDSSLPASYTPFGTIVSGLNVIQNVAKAGTDNSNGAGDGQPKEKVVIESVTIKKT